MPNLLYIGATYPEPNTTAAGVRTSQLLYFFKAQGYEVYFATTAKATTYSSKLQWEGISFVEIELNATSFNSWIKTLNPEIVLFDRYITEEQFGWRVLEVCPEAIRILDTQDLHFLRKAREAAYKRKEVVSEKHLLSTYTKRELASILRSDLSLVISKAEQRLLIDKFSIPPALLYYLPIWVEPINPSLLQDFKTRQDLLLFGNFLHAPNADAVNWLYTSLWPKIKAKLPAAKCFIYGAYNTTNLQSKNGVYFKGWSSDLNNKILNARLVIAPLRFGAGLKGKILYAWQEGTPVVTTSIGAEGLNEEADFGGSIADTDTDFVKAVTLLYTQQKQWEKAQSEAVLTLRKQFYKPQITAAFSHFLKEFLPAIKQHRNKHFISQVLQHHTLQSTRYLSKWIETKAKLKALSDNQNRSDLL